MDTIMIIGAHGQLGSDLRNLLRTRELAVFGSNDLDITNERSVDTSIREVSPRVVFNCAAWNRVDDAEDAPSATFAVNTFGPLYLARACEKAGALLVHLSTNYVFDGLATKPYPENAPPTPGSVYAMSKFAGEQLVRVTTDRHMVVRTSGLYGHQNSGGKGTNFVETMLRLGREHPVLKVVADQHLTPTYTEDLARFLIDLSDRWIETRSADLLGTWHATNAGGCSWYSFTEQIMALANLPAKVLPVTTAEYGARAHRPANGLLDCERIKRAGLPALRSWENALAEYLTRRDRN